MKSFKKNHLIAFLLTFIVVFVSCSKEKSNPQIVQKNNPGDKELASFISPHTLDPKLSGICNIGSPSNENSCCTTKLVKCPTGLFSYRLTGCWDWKFDLKHLTYRYKMYVNGVYVTGAQLGIQQRIGGCNNYEIGTSYDSNGNPVNHLCFEPTPSQFNPNCPAKIRLETYWHYSLNSDNVTKYCGYNSETINWPGNPSLCIMEF